VLKPHPNAACRHDADHVGASLLALSPLHVAALATQRDISFWRPLFSGSESTTYRDTNTSVGPSRGCAPKSRYDGITAEINHSRVVMRRDGRYRYITGVYYIERAVPGIG